MEDPKQKIQVNDGVQQVKTELFIIILYETKQNEQVSLIVKTKLKEMISAIIFDYSEKQNQSFTLAIEIEVIKWRIVLIRHFSMLVSPRRFVTVKMLWFHSNPSNLSWSPLMQKKPKHWVSHNNFIYNHKFNSDID